MGYGAASVPKPSVADTMDILRTRLLGGPNLWAGFPVTEVWLDFSSLPTEALPTMRRDVALGLRALFRRGGLPRRVGIQQRSSQCLWLAQAFEWTLLQLAAYIGHRHGFSQARASLSADIYGIAVDYREGYVSAACAQSALTIFSALRAGAPCDLPATVEALRAAAERERPSPSCAALLLAAQRRGIPVRRRGQRLLELGQGVHQRRIHDTHSDRCSPVAGWAAADRDLLRSLLGSAGIPCSEERVLGAHYRLLVAGGRLAAALHWQPSSDPRLQEGTAADVSDLVPGDYATRAIDAARVLGAEVAEVRLVARDLTDPPDAQEGLVTEIVPGPPLDLYLEAAPALQVAERVMDVLFPAGQTGRVPVIAVTGTNGKTTVTRLLAHALSLWGRFVAMTCTDGIFLAERCIDTDDCSGPQSARRVLSNPQVEVALLETARGGILREGLGFDLCDLALVTNIGEGDHLGLSGIETTQQLAEVKQTVVKAVAPWGTAVLNGADALVASMANHCRGRVIFFARDGSHPRLLGHRCAGERVAFVREHDLILAEGDLELPPIPLGRIPLTGGGRIGFQIENILACAGALWALNLPYDTLRLALETFGGNLGQSPGRFNVMEMNGATVVFDYGHNPSALLAMIDALGQFPHLRRIAVYSAAGDRRDVDMIRQGEILGQSFDRVILYEDHYRRGRMPGEIISLFRQGLSGAGRVQEVQAIHGWRNAVEHALWLAQPGDLVLVQADKIDETVSYVRERLLAPKPTPIELPLDGAAPSTMVSPDPPTLLAQA